MLDFTEIWKIYLNIIYTKDITHKVSGGFKLFFDEDKPRLMTAKQVMGLESVSGAK